MNIIYSELLEDYKWKEKRQKIFKRDNYQCFFCNNDQLLHVHHLKYTSYNPWEEDDKNLITVCESCHNRLHSKDTSYYDFTKNKSKILKGYCPDNGKLICQILFTYGYNCDYYQCSKCKDKVCTFTINKNSPCLEIDNCYLFEYIDKIFNKSEKIY